MTPEIAKRLLDARNACLEIVTFVDGVSRDAFLADRKLQLSVQALLSVVGEALSQARRLDPLLESRIPEIHSIIGMRHRIIHGYGDVDYKLLWLASTTRVPELAQVLTRLVNNEPPITPHDTDF